MTTKLWFQQGQSDPYKASIPKDSEDISDLITLIRKDFDVREQLLIPKDCGTIKLLYHKTSTAIDVGLTLQELTREVGFVNDRNHPIVVQIHSSRKSSKTDLFDAGTDLLTVKNVNV